MNKNIPLFWPYIPKNKILKELKNTLESRWIGQGPKVDRFELEFSKKFGYKYPLFVNSGTSALELAYHLIGLKEGDEVIVPVFDCTAGQMGLLRRGVKIVFADINGYDFNISLEDIKRKVTRKTKAIVAAAMGGIDINPEIYKFVKKKGIPLIVDASQHHEPKVIPGDYVCYSFQAIKHITTADGGMLCLSNKKEYKRAKLLRWFGIDRELKRKKNFQAWERRQMTFDIKEAGYKYQPTDVDASFGLAALPDLEKVIAYRKALVREYLKNLKSVPQIRSVVGGSCWLFTILTKDRDNLASFLTENGIENNLVHLRNDIYAIFGGKRQDLPNMNRIEPEYLCLPLNPKVTKSDVRFICNKIKEFFERKSH